MIWNYRVHIPRLVLQTSRSPSGETVSVSSYFADSIVLDFGAEAIFLPGRIARDVARFFRCQISGGTLWCPCRTEPGEESAVLLDLGERNFSIPYNQLLDHTHDPRSGMCLSLISIAPDDALPCLGLSFFRVAVVIHDLVQDPLDIPSKLTVVSQRSGDRTHLPRPSSSRVGKI